MSQTDFPFTISFRNNKDFLVLFDFSFFALHRQTNKEITQNKTTICHWRNSQAFLWLLFGIVFAKNFRSRSSFCCCCYLCHSFSFIFMFFSVLVSFMCFVALIAFQSKKHEKFDRSLLICNSQVVFFFVLRSFVDNIFFPTFLVNLRFLCMIPWFERKDVKSANKQNQFIDDKSREKKKHVKQTDFWVNIFVNQMSLK